MTLPNDKKSIIKGKDLVLHLALESEKTHVPEFTHPRKPEITRVLRWGGGLVLTAAAVAFMCQGVYSFAPITRHWIMLAICGLLGLLGIITGTMLNEEKGARAFLGFAAASFPVLSSQLGAMFFSLFGRPPQGMPTPLVFSLASSSTVITITALTLVILVPVSFLAFRILARSQAFLLTGSFTAANLCILLPVREGIGLGVLIAAISLGIYCIDTTFFQRDFRLENFEGKVARLLLAAPLVVILGRTFFYTVNHTFFSLLFALLGTYLSFHWGRVAKSISIRKGCRLTGMACLAAGWLTFLLPSLHWTSEGHGWMTFLILLPLAAIPGIQSLVTDDEEAVIYRTTAGVIALLAVGLTHWLEATSMVSLVGSVVAILTIAAGTLMGEKLLFFNGLSALIISLGNFCLQAVTLHSSYAWIALALVGISVMFSASLIEKGRKISSLKGYYLWGRFKT